MSQKACPECGSKVNAEHLRRHLNRVHGQGPAPMESVRERPRGGRRGPALSGPGARRLLYVTVAIAVIGLVAAAYILSPKAIAFADHQTFDLGDVPPAVREHTFPLENRGTVPLRIGGASTSCGCTSAQIITPGGESPIYGMPGHGEAPADWTGWLRPGETGSVRVIYDPLTHDGYYSGTREAYVDTSAGELTYTIRVNEVP